MALCEQRGADVIGVHTRTCSSAPVRDTLNLIPRAVGELVWVDVKADYRLAVDDDERRALDDLLATC